MAFLQLYYTSCEHGLSGFSGYQFNAVSGGVSAETMREAEALTGYEPPQSMLYSDAPADLARCPVNLCHLPGDTTLTACVRYVGRDPSQRFGNYFAHTLASRDFHADSGSLLPIELWGSQVWTTRPAEGTRLPPLAEPPMAGPLTPDAVERFLRGHPHGDQLPRLLTATMDALAEDRTVLLVDTSSDHVARWFAAVCYLLPPPVSRTLSFATYLARPERSRLRLVGTVPEAGVPTGPDVQDGFDVFDFTGGAFPELVPSPLSRLLDRVGPAASEPFWCWTTEYTEGDERAPGDWYLPAVAAAASGGIPLTETDLAAIIPWLADAEHLVGPSRAQAVGHVYRQGRFTGEQLEALSRAATASGDREIAEILQMDLLDIELRRHMEDQPDRSPPVRISSRERARQAVERVQSLLAKAGYPEVVRLLLWAQDARLRLRDEPLARACRRVGEGLLGDLTSQSVGPRLTEQLRQLAARQPEFREQLVLSLAERQPRHRGHLAEVFNALPEGLLRGADLDDHPSLLEGYLMALAEREPERRPELLPRILEVTGTRELTGSLLRFLWPNGRWSHRHALAVVRRLPADVRTDEDARKWFTAVVRRGPDDETALRYCVELCRALLGPGRDRWLTGEGHECGAALLELVNQIGSGTAPDSGTLVRILRQPWPILWASVHALRRYLVPAAAARCRAVPDDVPRMLHYMGHETSLTYLRRVGEELPKQAPRDAMAHAEGLVAAFGRADPRQWLLIDEALNTLTGGWQARDVRRFADRVRPRSESYAAKMTALAEEKEMGPVRRLTRRARRRRDRR